MGDKRNWSLVFDNKLDNEPLFPFVSRYSYAAKLSLGICLRRPSHKATTVAAAVAIAPIMAHVSVGEAGRTYICSQATMFSTTLPLHTRYSIDNVLEPSWCLPQTTNTPTTIPHFSILRTSVPVCEICVSRTGNSRRTSYSSDVKWTTSSSRSSRCLIFT